MSDIRHLLLEKKLREKKKIKVKNPKEITFYFLNERGDKIIKGYAWGVDIKKLDFIKKYSFWYHPFAEGGFKMFEVQLKREFEEIGAIMGSLEDYRVYLDKYRFDEDTPTNGFIYEMIKRPPKKGQNKNGNP